MTALEIACYDLLEKTKKQVQSFPGWRCAAVRLRRRKGLVTARAFFGQFGGGDEVSLFAKSEAAQVSEALQSLVSTIARLYP